MRCETFANPIACLKRHEELASVKTWAAVASNRQVEEIYCFILALEGSLRVIAKNINSKLRTLTSNATSNEERVCLQMARIKDVQITTNHDMYLHVSADDPVPNEVRGSIERVRGLNVQFHNISPLLSKYRALCDVWSPSAGFVLRVAENQQELGKLKERSSQEISANIPLDDEEEE